jgi:hypothetical protein
MALLLELLLKARISISPFLCPIWAPFSRTSDASRHCQGEPRSRSPCPMSRRKESQSLPQASRRDRRKGWRRPAADVIASSKS